MRLAICGTDEKAIKIKHLLESFESCGVTIEMLIGPKLQGLDFENVLIITENELLSNNYLDYMDGFVISPEYYGLTRMAAIKRIKSSIYLDKKIYIPDFVQLQEFDGCIKPTIDSLLIPYEESSQMFYLEVHAADHCNLNCKGCMHFSPLVRENVFPDFNRLSKDIHHLRKFIKHIEIIRILGGEPLLNPELEKYICLLRDVYPFSNINIVTNGILIEKMSTSLCDIIREKSIHIHVSLYPPVENRKERIEAFLKQKKIIFQISDRIGKFTSTYRNEAFRDKMLAKEQCDIFCNNLRDGKISCCPNIMYTHYYNECFGDKYPVEDGMIDIYEIKSAKDLHQRLNEPVSLCEYCDRSNLFDWEISKNNYSDWLNKE